MKKTLVWLRRDLRLYDNAALHHALQQNNQVWLAFIFDIGILKPLIQGELDQDGLKHDRRVDFIWQGIQQIDEELRQQGGGLIIRYGNPTECIPQIARELGVDAVFTNRDYEPSAIARDQMVKDKLSELDIEFEDFKDQVIFEKPKNRDAQFRQYLEKQICKNADLVWWFTDGALHYSKVRNSNLNTKANAHGFMVLPGAKPPGGLEMTQVHGYSDKLNLCHFGSLANDRSLSTILNALATLLKKYPQAREYIRVHAYGAPLDSLTLEAIKLFNFQDVLLAHGRLERDPATGISGRERVVVKMQTADVLILLHGNDEWCAEYIPSKFYEYLWAGRPIWGITHRNPQLDQMLEERSAYLSHEGDLEGISMALERIWLDWQQKCLMIPVGVPIGVDQAAYKILSEIQENL